MRGRWEHAMEYAQPIKPLKPPERQLSTSETPRPTPASAQPLCAPAYCGGARWKRCWRRAQDAEAGSPSASPILLYMVSVQIVLHCNL